MNVRINWIALAFAVGLVLCAVRVFASEPEGSYAFEDYVEVARFGLGFGIGTGFAVWMLGVVARWIRGIATGAAASDRTI